jgi:RimJ/RimL family protein N-acetyltransferase
MPDPPAAMLPHIAHSTELSDERIRLRPVEDGDAPKMYAAVDESRDQLARWLPWCTPDYGLEQAEEFTRLQRKAWRDASEFTFVIIDRGSGELLGSCGLNRLDWRNLSANLGYWIRTSAHGRGIATTATRLVLRFAFEQLKLQRVEIVAAEGNIASQRVAEKVGACKEALARNRCRGGGRPQDAYVYSVVPEDLRE